MGRRIRNPRESGSWCCGIAANREGMLSLAKQLTALAEAAPGQHIHFDEFNSLEEGSAEMIIVREK